jgi:hypothetical protein
MDEVTDVTASGRAPIASGKVVARIALGRPHQYADAAHLLRFPADKSLSVGRMLASHARRSRYGRFMADRPWAGRMCWRGPDHIARRTHYPAAEALAEFNTSELTTGMTAAFHDGNSPNAVSASRLASSTVALSLRASCLLLDSRISRPHCWRDRIITAGPPPSLVGHQHSRTRKVAPRNS